MKQVSQADVRVTVPAPGPDVCCASTPGSLSPREVLHYPARTVLLLCAVLGLSLSGVVRADDPVHPTCTGWDGKTSEAVNLGIPPTVTLPVDAVPGSIIATGSATLPVPPLQCTSVSTGQPVTTTAWSWNNGYDSGTDSIQVAPGVGLKLFYSARNSFVIGGTPSLPASGGSADTGGFDWTSLTWQLVRTSDTAGTGQNTPGTIGTGTLQLPDGDVRLLYIQQPASVTLTAACTLSTDNSTVTLPDTDAAALARDGYSDSRNVEARITCPANTMLVSGITLTLATPQTESSDATLVGNTGSARGVAIEVLNDRDGQRVSALGGSVTRGRFFQSSASAPGTTQTFRVRMNHLPGQTVTAGTVQGTFTLTLSVN